MAQADRVVDFLTAVGDGDVDRLAEYWTDDFVLEFPYADPPRALEGKSAVCAHLREALDTFRIRLRVTDVYQCPDREVIIAEYVSDGEVATTGRPYQNRYIGVFMFRGEKITWQREFYNPIPALEALR
jgi:ketosteroid isomerase-like protein